MNVYQREAAAGQCKSQTPENENSKGTNELSEMFASVAVREHGYEKLGGLCQDGEQEVCLRAQLWR